MLGVARVARPALLARDRIGEPRDHADVGALHARVGEQRDPGPVDQRVAPGPREDQCPVGELRRERRGHVPEPLEVGRVQVDDEPVRDQGPVGGREPL